MKSDLALLPGRVVRGRAVQLRVADGLVARLRLALAPATELRYVDLERSGHVIVDWKEIERAWLQAVTDAIIVTAASNPTERFYAGAFWMLYGDYSSLLVPAFGLNSENSASNIRWHPPNWRWSIIDDAHESVRPLYQPLLSLAVERETFEGLWEQHVAALARVSKRVTMLAKSNQIAAGHSTFSHDFFVGIIDFSQGDDAIDWLRRSVDEETLVGSGILEFYS